MKKLSDGLDRFLCAISRVVVPMEPLSPELKEHVIRELSGGPLHGYELYKRLKAMPGLIDRNYGLLYPLLMEMVDRKELEAWVKYEDGHARRYFALKNR